MACSAIYFLDNKGKVLLNRNYRGDIDNSVIDNFISLVNDVEDESLARPLIKTNDCTFAYIKHSNIYIVATSRTNCNVALLFSLLYKVKQVMAEYFKEVEEESIRDNFVICYELLDEMVDFGYPQTTDAKILQEYITHGNSK